MDAGRVRIDNNLVEGNNVTYSSTSSPGGAIGIVGGVDITLTGNTIRNNATSTAALDVTDDGSSTRFSLIQNLIYGNVLSIDQTPLHESEIIGALLARSSSSAAVSGAGVGTAANA